MAINIAKAANWFPPLAVAGDCSRFRPITKRTEEKR